MNEYDDALMSADNRRCSGANSYCARWWTFLRNHASEIAATDFFVVPTIGFDLLYAFVVRRMDGMPTCRSEVRTIAFG